MVMACVGTLHHWAQLGHSLRDAEFGELMEIVNRSRERLRLFGEPLKELAGLDRWLGHAREEVYSDWLQWLFEQMNAEELINVLTIRDLPADTRQRAQSRVRVAREPRVEEGHEGHQGRIDLTLELGNWAVVAVEVKKGDADSADTKKQTGYRTSIEREYRERPKSFILLAASSSKAIIYGFEVRTYGAFCRNLRRLAISWAVSRPLLKAATTLAIVAAIETNLLHYSVGRTSFTADTLSHLKQFVDTAGYE